MCERYYLGANINLMQFSMMKKLNFGNVIKLTLFNMFVNYYYGKVEDVLVQVNDLYPYLTL